MNTTERGFAVYAEVVDSRGNTVKVQESSADGGPFCWLFTKNRQGFDHSITDAVGVRNGVDVATPHLTREQARALAAALTQFADRGSTCHRCRHSSLSPNPNGCAICNPEELGRRLTAALAERDDFKRRFEVLARGTRGLAIEDAERLKNDQTTYDARLDDALERERQIKALLVKMVGEPSDPPIECEKCGAGICDHVSTTVLQNEQEIARLKNASVNHGEPIPMRLVCEGCGELHIDEGDFATKPHHTHACQFCGLPWRPAIQATVGVRFLPGFKNKEERAHVTGQLCCGGRGCMRTFANCEDLEEHIREDHRNS